jgi:hypothetical protein
MNDKHLNAALAILREIADMPRDDDGDVIIGADETGHNHVMEGIANLLAEIEAAA